MSAPGTDLMLQVINAAEDVEGFVGAALLVRTSIEKGRNRDHAMLLASLAYKGHVLNARTHKTTPSSPRYMSTDHEGMWRISEAVRLTLAAEPPG